MHRQHVSLAVLVVCLSSPISTSIAIGEDDSWVGKEVIVKQSGVKVYYTAPDGTLRQMEIKGIVQKVRSVKDGMLEVGNDGEPGWLKKSEVVLISDATEYFANRIQASPNDSDAYGHRGVAWIRVIQ